MKPHKQHGGTFLGFIMGLILGLGVALVVAIYVTKSPTSMSTKSQVRSNDHAVQENQKNKDWNPNSMLQVKPAAPSPADAGTAPVITPIVNPPKPGTKQATDTAKPALAQPKPLPSVSADPLGDLTKNKSAPDLTATPDQVDPAFVYLIQTGAFQSSSDADAQKVKLILMGLDANRSETKQGGRTLYRVRVGPIADKADAERISKRLEGSGIENTVLQIQR